MRSSNDANADADPAVHPGRGGTGQGPIDPSPREATRLASAQRLRASQLVGSTALDRIADLASRLTGASAGQVALMAEVQTIVGGAGLAAGDVGSTCSLRDAVCTVTIAGGGPLVVPDARRDPRTADRAGVLAGVVGAYLGVPLATTDGSAVGTLCVYDPQPRTWQDYDIALVQQLAASVVAELELAALLGEQHLDRTRWELAAHAAHVGTFEVDLVTGVLTTDPRMTVLLGHSPQRPPRDVEALVAHVHPEDVAAVRAALGAAATGGGLDAEHRVLADGSVRWVNARGRAVRSEDGTPVRQVGVVLDVTERVQRDARAAQEAEAARDAAEAAARQRSEDARAMAGMVSIAQAMGWARTEADVLVVVDEWATSLLGAYAVGLALVTPHGDQVRGLSTSYNADVRAQAAFLPVHPPLPFVHTAVTGEAVFLSDLPSILAAFPASRELYVRTGTQASAAVPLLAQDRLLGSLSVAHDSPRTWSATDRELMQAFAAMTAQALDRIEALAAAEASAGAEHVAATQQAALVAVAQDLAHAEDESEVLGVVSTRGLHVLDASTAALCLVMGDGTQVRTLTTEAVLDDIRVQLAQLPASFPLPLVHCATSGQEHYYDDLAATVAAFPAAEPICTALDVHAQGSAPLHASGLLLGSLSFGFAHDRTWPEQDRDLLQAFAALTAQALARISAREAERVAVEAERATNAVVARFSETLQRSLLTAPAEPDHLQIAVRYAPATAAAYVGGDWYDAFMTGGGATSLVIGDVAGHDQQAAAAMSALRNTLRGIGYTIGQPPAAVLTALDRAVHDLGLNTVATMVLAQVEQDDVHRAAGTRLLRWSNAGHPPPLLIEADGAVRYLGAADLSGTEAEAKVDLVIGIDPATTRHDHEVVLAPGATVLLYTDGLVERRGVGLDRGLAWLAEAVTDLAQMSLEDLVDALLGQIGQVEDDVALLALRAHPEDRPRPVEAGPRRAPADEPALIDLGGSTG